jgi:hypothetical protein
MQFSPTQRLYINGFLLVLGVIVAGGPAIFPDYIPVGAAKNIIQTCGLLLAIVSPLVAGTMSALSSPKQGPLAPTPPAVIVAAQQLVALPVDAHPVTVAEAKATVVAAVATH